MHHLNPYAPPSSSDGEAQVDQSKESRSRRYKWLRLAIAAFALTLFIGVAVAAYDIETIVGSGPVLLLAGALLATLGFRKRDRLAVLLGASSFVLAALVIALINLVPYSPTTGYWPLLAIISLYASVSLPIAGWMLILRRSAYFDEVD